MAATKRAASTVRVHIRFLGDNLARFARGTRA